MGRKLRARRRASDNRMMILLGAALTNFKSGCDLKFLFLASKRISLSRIERSEDLAVPVELELSRHSEEANQRIFGDIDDCFILSRGGFGKSGIGG